MEAASSRRSAAGPAYLVQRKGLACGLYALCNCARCLGFDTPEPGTLGWSRLAARIDPVRAGDDRLLEVADAMGIALSWVPDPTVLAEAPPGIMIVPNPSPAAPIDGLGATHAIAVVGGDGAHAATVSYRGKMGVDPVPWQDLRLGSEGGWFYAAWSARVFDPDRLRSWDSCAADGFVKRVKRALGW